MSGALSGIGRMIWAGFSSRKLVCGPIADGAGEIRGSVQCPVVMNDCNAVARQADIELQAIGSELNAMIEGSKRVLGTKRAAAAVRERQRTRSREKRMSHRFGEV